MDTVPSPARFLACLMAEHDVPVKQLCERCGLDDEVAWSFLAGRLPVTPALAERLGAVFHSPGFWLTRQAVWERSVSEAGEQADRARDDKC